MGMRIDGVKGPSLNKKGLPWRRKALNRLFGGAERDRTVDLMTASHALSQLSYSPLN